MRVRQLVVSVVAVSAGVLAAVSTAGPAQAAAPAVRTTAVHVLTAPPAPSGAQAVAASAPTISPSVSTQHVASGSSYSCSQGTLCAAVWDPTTSNYKVFHLVICAKYALSYWHGTGSYFDNQTGGVTSYFYGETGNILKSFRPDVTNHSYTWDNVWSIRNC